MKNKDVGWGHQGTIGKFHVDIGNSHHHSPTLNPPARDKHGHIKVRSWKEMPPPYGPIK